MGVNWNPSFPTQIGVERIDTPYDSFSISSSLAQHALQFRALHTGAVSNIELYGSSGTTAPQLPLQFYNQTAPIMCDLYPISGSPYILPQTIQLDTFNVSSVTGTSSIFNEDLTQPINVNRITLADGLFLASSTASGFVQVQFPTQNFPLDRRILNVRLLVRANAKTNLKRVDSDGVGTWNYTVSISGGYTSWGPSVGETFIDNPTQPTWGWWTPQIIRDFKANGSRHWTIQAKQTGWRLDTVRMEVYWIPETRIGVGIKPPQVGWTSFDMKSPAGTGTPSVTTGSDYVAVARRPVADSLFSVSSAVLAWRKFRGWLPATTAPPVTGWGSVNMTVTSVTPTGSTFGTPPGMPTVKKSDPIVYTQDVMCGRMTTGGPQVAGGTVVETSMPYELPRPCVVHAVGNSYPARSVTQSIVVTGAATSQVYGQTSVIVGWVESTKPKLTDTLRVEVWNVTTTPVRVFSPVERTFADISRVVTSATFDATDEGGTTRLVRFRHPESLTLTAGTYEIRISSSNATQSNPFRISSLIATSHTVDQTYGRNTQVGTGFWIQGSPPVYTPLNGTGPTGVNFIGDVQTTLMTVPPAVTGVAASIGVMTAHHADVCAGVLCRSANCGDQGCPFIQLNWSASSDTGTDHYEIQRSDLIDDVFRTVAFVQGRTAVMWQDHEARIGVRSCYRIRSVRTDNVTGDWSATVCAAPQPGIVALSFSSNAATGLSVTAGEVWSSSPITRGFTFSEYDDVEFKSMYGRERQVAFHPQERRGMTFSRTVLLNALCTVNPPTMGLFAPLRVLSWAGLPYVCVRDGEGNRWYANLRMPEGSNVRSGEQWYAEINVTEVQQFATPVNTGDPQLEDALVL